MRNKHDLVPAQPLPLKKRAPNSLRAPGDDHKWVIETAKQDLDAIDSDYGIIKRVETLNYRSLRDVSQILRPLEVLVGANASGKSTFIDVFALVRDFIRDGLDQALLFNNGVVGGRAGSLDELVFDGSANHFEIALELTVPRPLIQPHDINGTEYVYDIARYELAIGTTDLGELDVQTERLWLIDSRRRMEPVPPKPDDRSDVFPVEVAPRRTLLHDATITIDIAARNILVGQASDYWRPVAIQSMSNRGNVSYFSEQHSWNDSYRVGVRRSVLSSLPEDPERFPIAIWVRNVLRDGIRVLALNSAAMRRPVSPSASREFDVEGANLPLVIQDLQKQQYTSYNDWVQHVKTVLPDIEEIHVRERSDDRFRYLSIKYSRMASQVPSWLISDGTMRVLTLTLLAYLPEQPRIYLIEEPENGIHPKAIEGIFQSLSSVYNGQVLIATHSPLFLSLAQPKQILCFGRTPAGAVNIISGERHPALRHWHGQTDLATLYAAGVLG